MKNSLRATLLPLIGGILIIATYMYAERYNWVGRPIFGLGYGVLALLLAQRQGPPTHRYALLTLPLLLIGCWMPSSTVFYAACCTLFLWLVEQRWGRRSNLALLLMALLAPFVSYMANTWSFPIRLQLTDWAAGGLHWVGFDVVAQGNIVVFDGQDFSVDTACMGLQMLVTAAVLAVFVMAQYERQAGRAVPVGWAALGLCAMLVLAVLANYLRLLALIVFRVLPDSPMHDFIGLLSLSVYALLPFYLGWRAVTGGQGVGRPFQAGPGSRSANHKKIYGPLLVAAFGLLFYQAYRLHPDPLPSPSAANFQLPGYASSTTATGMIQLKSERTLIYIKPLSHPFKGTHDPKVCWQGSGYEFQRLDTLHVAGQVVYAAQLQKGEDRLHTAWWYDNGPETTISEWGWRWGMLRSGTPYYLVNVTVGKEAELAGAVVEALGIY